MNYGKKVKTFGLKNEDNSRSIQLIASWFFLGFFLGFFPHQVWNDLEWQQLLENLPDLKSITTPLKCDKNKGLPDGMLTLCNLETLTAHSILRADHVLFRDVSRLSSLRQLCIQILCVDVLVERTEALRQLALLRDLEDLELTIRRYSLSHTCKQDFQYLLYHLVCGPFYTWNINLKIFDNKCWI